MRTGAGKAKGNAFEREVCKRLSLWITHGKRDDILWRSAISGGRATVHAKKNKMLAHVAGDICATHSLGEEFIRAFYVECKAYRDLGFAGLLTKGEGKLAEFWRETCTAAEKFGKHPLLIFKQNQYPVMVGVNVLGFDDLPLPGVHHTGWAQLPYVIFTDMDLTLVRFEDLMNRRYE